MNNILKKISILSLMVFTIFLASYNSVLAYNEDSEELKMNYNTKSIQENAQKRVNQMIRQRSYSPQKFTVVLDAGHGGKDSGAVNSTLKMYEKNLNLDIAKAAKERLSSYGINVVMIRENDTFVELAERSAIANKLNADLFVSLHNDTQEGNGDGTHVIHSVYDKNGGISKTLATDIANSIKNKTSQNLRKHNPVWSRYYPDQSYDYYSVIRQTNMPAVIVEHAYMNANDIKAVDTLEKRNIMGRSVADGIYKTINENFSGWVNIKGMWKYYDSQTKMAQKGWQLINGKWYLFDTSGIMSTGWQMVNGKWYLMGESGAMLTGWQLVNGAWYFIDGSGAMLTGWQVVNGKWYFMNEAGVMLSGWQMVNGAWYFMDGSGAMQTGWQVINGKWYFMNGSGAMLTGWQMINNKWYFMDGSGAMVTGWLKSGETSYFMDGSGAMVTGWLTLGSDVYYFDQSGLSVSGSVEIDGTIHNFDKDGKLIK